MYKKLILMLCALMCLPTISHAQQPKPSFKDRLVKVLKENAVSIACISILTLVIGALVYKKYTATPDLNSNQNLQPNGGNKNPSTANKKKPARKPTALGVAENDDDGDDNPPAPPRPDTKGKGPATRPAYTNQVDADLDAGIAASLAHGQMTEEEQIQAALNQSRTTFQQDLLRKNGGLSENAATQQIINQTTEEYEAQERIKNEEKRKLNALASQLDAEERAEQEAALERAKKEDELKQKTASDEAFYLERTLKQKQAQEAQQSAQKKEVDFDKPNSSATILASRPLTPPQHPVQQNQMNTPKPAPQINTQEKIVEQPKPTPQPEQPVQTEPATPAPVKEPSDEEKRQQRLAAIAERNKQKNPTPAQTSSQQSTTSNDEQKRKENALKAKVDAATPASQSIPMTTPIKKKAIKKTAVVKEADTAQ